METAAIADCAALMGMDWVLEMDPEETKYLQEPRVDQQMIEKLAVELR
jgi:hypothetical protein